MAYFEHAPLLPLTCCLIAGIAVGSHLPPTATWLWPLVLLAMVVAAWASDRWPLVQSIAIHVCFVVVGMTVAPHDKEQPSDRPGQEAVVASLPAERPKTLMVELLLPQTGEQRRWYFWKDEAARTLTIGDNLIVSIHDERFVWSGDWQRGGDGFNQLSRWQRVRLKALQWRGQLLASLRQQGGDEAALAVLAAMTLGDKSGLSAEIRETYSISGASHVLALSGLHLSIIYLLLTLLTLGRRRFWLGQVLLVVAIWAFALLTGLSNSLVRAATMLTIYSLFALGGRRHAPLGVLSFTAMLMLLIDANALFDVGFQLSFMAMLGILLFVPLFNRFVSQQWLLRHRLAKWLYGLACVSVAAQLGTAPLVAYYFGRFSTWFLLTNFLVIPAATIILAGAIVVLVMPAASTALLWVVGMLNSTLQGITKMPLASIEGLHPTQLQVALLYVAVGILYALFRKISCIAKSVQA